MSYDRNLGGRTHYYFRVTVAPDNEHETYYTTASFAVSLDGGVTNALRQGRASPGDDSHDMWIDPTNSDRMVVGNDGGVSITTNHGRSWNRIQLPIALGVLIDSFQSLPVSTQPLATVGFFNVAKFGSTMFAVGLQLALPVIAILLMTNLALGILTRSAPQLNIFAIGFPITLGVGLITLDITLPYFAPQFERLFHSGLRESAMLLKVLAGQ